MIRRWARGGVIPKPDDQIPVQALELINARQRIAGLGNQIAVLRTELAARDDTIAVLRTELDRARQKLDAFTQPIPDQLAVLLERIAQLERDNARLGETACTRSELLREQGRAAALEAEVQRLTQLSMSSDQPHLTGWAVET